MWLRAAAGFESPTLHQSCRGSSVVELLVANQKVAGSNPVLCSISGGPSLRAAIVALPLPVATLRLADVGGQKGPEQTLSALAAGGMVTVLAQGVEPRH